MRNISLRDLMLAEELSSIKNEIVLINPNNDKLVFSVLQQIGFDTKQEVNYVPSLHRDMQGKIAVGFQAVGEYDTDTKYRPFIDTLDRVIISGMRDISLAKDLIELMGKRYPYRNDDEAEGKSRKRNNDPRYYSDQELLDMGYTSGEEDEEETVEYVQEDYETVSKMIKTLEEVRDQIRGVK